MFEQRKNGKWVNKVHYPPDAKQGDWYCTTSVGAKRDDPEHKVNSVFIEIGKYGFSNPGFDVGHVMLRQSVPDFRRQFLDLWQEAVAKVDIMNRTEPEGSDAENACASCGQPAAENDFLCADCRVVDSHK